MNVLGLLESTKLQGVEVAQILEMDCSSFRWQIDWGKDDSWQHPEGMMHSLSYSIKAVDSRSGKLTDLDHCCLELLDSYLGVCSVASRTLQRLAGSRLGVLLRVNLIKFGILTKQVLKTMLCIRIMSDCDLLVVD